MANTGSSLEIDKEELCDRCKKIPSTAFFSIGKSRIGFEFELGPTEPYQLIEGLYAFEGLKLSASAGCSLCKLFQDALEMSNYHPDEELRRWPQSCKDGIRLQRGGPDDLSPENPSPDNLRITFGKLCSHQLDAWVIVHIDQSTTRSIEPASYVVENRSDSPANFDLARSWLAGCCEDHVHCRDSLEFEVPRRLLDVAMPSKPGMICLVSAFDLPTKSRVDYIALSHCWGSFWPLQTKKNNLRSHMQGISETRLPQTFQDAVRTTRELGLRYLWIDSLCIIQDEPPDFEAECARMNTIFANALCTISASDARDCRDGLFRSRTMKPIRLTYENDGSEPDLTITMQPTFSGPWVRGLQGPLQMRAWVLQERHLSPRIIHYTKKCLMWECRTAIASEYQQKMRAKADAQMILWPHLSSNRFLDGGRSRLGPEDSRSCPSNHKFRSLHDRWYRVVEDYSHRLLSHPEDKLPAVSGFAAEWKRMKPEDEYFAGLWKSDIFKGLAWFPTPTQHDIMRRPLDSDATWPPSSTFKGMPSWSWAAFEGPVTHFGKDWFNSSYDCDLSGLKAGQQLSPPTSRSLCLHDVTTTIEQLNPFGRVSNGEITVSGWSIVVSLSESDISAGCPFATVNAPKVYRLRPDRIQYFVIDGRVYFDHDPFYLPQIQVRLLRLGQGRSIQGYQARVCGLALLQVQTDPVTSNHLYRRVGMFDLDYHSFCLLRREWKAVTII